MNWTTPSVRSGILSLTSIDNNIFELWIGRRSCWVTLLSISKYLKLKIEVSHVDDDSNSIKLNEWMNEKKNHLNQVEREKFQNDNVSHWTDWKERDDHTHNFGLKRFSIARIANPKDNKKNPTVLCLVQVHLVSHAINSFRW